MKLTEIEKRNLLLAANTYFDMLKDNDNSEAEVVVLKTSYFSSVLDLIIKQDYGDEKVLAEIEFNNLHNAEEVMNYIEEHF